VDVSLTGRQAQRWYALQAAAQILNSKPSAPGGALKKKGPSVSKKETDILECHTERQAASQEGHKGHPRAWLRCQNPIVPWLHFPTVPYNSLAPLSYSAL
jgi:hypothetical protein